MVYILLHCRCDFCQHKFDLTLELEKSVTMPTCPNNCAGLLVWLDSWTIHAEQEVD